MRLEAAGKDGVRCGRCLSRHVRAFQGKNIGSRVLWIWWECLDCEHHTDAIPVPSSVIRSV